MDKTFPAEEVADLLGTNIESLRNWRRLKPDHPRHLGATLDANNKYQYRASDILDWMHRPINNAYREVVLASFVPDTVRDWFERHRRHQQTQATQQEVAK